MRILLFILAILLSAGYVRAQENEIEINISGLKPLDNYKESSTHNYAEASESVDSDAGNINNIDVSVPESKRKKSPFEFVKAKRFVKEQVTDEKDIKDILRRKKSF